ncbi:MAG: PAS domain-containing protein, partial [Frankiaceae bacterium]
STVSEDMLVATAGTDEHLRLAHELALSSVVTVPMSGRSGLFGAIQLCYGTSARRYDQDDLRLLEDLAARAAVAADNARAYARQTGRRERSEAALRRSEERFQLVDSATDDAMFMLDPKGQVLTWNSGAHRVQGYDADEVIGEHFRRFYPPDARASHRPEHALAVASADGRHAEQGWRVRKDGTRFWAHVVITALRDAQGDLIGFGLVTREVPAQAP